MASQQHHSRQVLQPVPLFDRSIPRWPESTCNIQQSLDMRKQEWQRFFSSCDTRFSPQVSLATKLGSFGCSHAHNACVCSFSILICVAKTSPFSEIPTGHIKNQEPVPKDSDLGGNGLHVFSSKVTRGFVGVVCSLAIPSLLTFQEH